MGQMCGISGFLDRANPAAFESALDIAAAMSRTLRHRGPDDNGVWADSAAGIALAHQRLAILDLSALGHQPMFSADGRLAVVFNGEIYNFQEIRAELEALGHAFRSSSDTEVMLAAFAQWGVEPALRRFNGMFAFALWDRSSRTLYLARDRLGKKPLYYGWSGSAFLFASELKALRAYPGFDAPIDRDVLALYLRHAYIPAPYSIYRGIRKLPAGCWLALPPGPAGETPLPQTYWSFTDAAANSRRHPIQQTEEALEELDRLLRSAVGLRMISDVPLGAFLSGGVDSSLVVALMQALSSRPVKTFSIGFHDELFDEAPYAKAVAEHLGTEHTELYATPREALDVIPRLPEFFDEPFADSSQIPTFLVCQLTRRHVTVSLSGDGGDELFGGYQAYLSNSGFWRRFGRRPWPLRRLGAWALHSLPEHVWDTLFGVLKPVLPNALWRPQAGARLHRLADTLAQRSPEGLYMALMSYWGQPRCLLPGAQEPPTAFTRSPRPNSLADFIETMMNLDTLTYLPDDILVKVDRTSMAVSLEARCPLLDYRVAEFAWRLPLSMKIRRQQGKWLLRQLLYRYVPEALLNRPKAGFAVPLAAWLRGPLRDWAEDLLHPDRLRREGVFQPAPIRHRWDQHLRHTHDWSNQLWIILMFQAWLASQTKTS